MGIVVAHLLQHFRSCWPAIILLLAVGVIGAADLNQIALDETPNLEARRSAQFFMWFRTAILGPVGVILIGIGIAVSVIGFAMGSIRWAFVGLGGVVFLAAAYGLIALFSRDHTGFSPQPFPFFGLQPLHPDNQLDALQFHTDWHGFYGTISFLASMGCYYCNKLLVTGWQYGIIPAVLIGFALKSYYGVAVENRVQAVTQYFIKTLVIGALFLVPVVNYGPSTLTRAAETGGPGGGHFDGVPGVYNQVLTDLIPSGSAADGGAIPLGPALMFVGTYHLTNAIVSGMGLVESRYQRIIRESAMEFEPAFAESTYRDLSNIAGSAYRDFVLEQPDEAVKRLMPGFYQSAYGSRNVEDPEKPGETITEPVMRGLGIFQRRDLAELGYGHLTPWQSALCMQPTALGSLPLDFHASNYGPRGDHRAPAILAACQQADAPSAYTFGGTDNQVTWLANNVHRSSRLVGRNPIVEPVFDRTVTESRRFTARTMGRNPNRKQTYTVYHHKNHGNPAARDFFGLYLSRGLLEDYMTEIGDGDLSLETFISKVYGQLEAACTKENDQHTSRGTVIFSIATSDYDPLTVFAFPDMEYGKDSEGRAGSGPGYPSVRFAFRRNKDGSLLHNVSLRRAMLENLKAAAQAVGTKDEKKSDLAASLQAIADEYRVLYTGGPEDGGRQERLYLNDDLNNLQFVTVDYSSIIRSRILKEYIPTNGAGRVVRNNSSRGWVDDPVFSGQNHLTQSCRQAALRAWEGHGNEDLWGCLAVGSYSPIIVDAETAKANFMRRLQAAFDDRIREPVMRSSGTHLALNLGGDSPTQDQITNSLQWSPIFHHTGQGQDHSEKNLVQAFDVAMACHGAKTSLGLMTPIGAVSKSKGPNLDLLGAPPEDMNWLEEAFWWIVNQIIRIIGMLGIYLAKVAIYMLPYVIGIIVMVMLIVLPFFAAYAAVGTWSPLFSFAQAVVWIGIWPIPCLLGMQLVELVDERTVMKVAGANDATATPTLNAVRLMGAGLVVMCPVFASALMDVSGRGLQSLGSTVYSTAFKVAGAVTQIIAVAVAGIATAAAAGVGMAAGAAMAGKTAGVASKVSSATASTATKAGQTGASAGNQASRAVAEQAVRWSDMATKGTARAMSTATQATAAAAAPFGDAGAVAGGAAQGTQQGIQAGASVAELGVRGRAWMVGGARSDAGQAIMLHSGRLGDQRKVAQAKTKKGDRLDGQRDAALQSGNTGEATRLAGEAADAHSVASQIYAQNGMAPQAHGSAMAAYKNAQLAHKGGGMSDQHYQAYAQQAMSTASNHMEMAVANGQTTAALHAAADVAAIHMDQQGHLTDMAGAAHAKAVAAGKESGISWNGSTWTTAGLDRAQQDLGAASDQLGTLRSAHGTNDLQGVMRDRQQRADDLGGKLDTFDAYSSANESVASLQKAYQTNDLQGLLDSGMLPADEALRIDGALTRQARAASSWQAVSASLGDVGAARAEHQAAVGDVQAIKDGLATHASARSAVDAERGVLHEAMQMNHDFRVMNGQFQHYSDAAADIGSRGQRHIQQAYQAAEAALPGTIPAGGMTVTVGKELLGSIGGMGAMAVMTGNTASFQQQVASTISQLHAMAQAPGIDPQQQHIINDTIVGTQAIANHYVAAGGGTPTIQADGQLGGQTGMSSISALSGYQATSGMQASLTALSSQADAFDAAELASETDRQDIFKDIFGIATSGSALDLPGGRESRVSILVKQG